ncbi:MAG: hypothetical protein HGB03_04250 [Candidatus Yonathbacteria bacterium]|nr:hypothetical protein [Candidatus Yonathbacteria bacterium]NTW47560.1 hypothetical protein [Candidatus Yonathbacteria bacterium]
MHHSRGLSIVETIVTVAAATVVLIGLISFVLSLYRTNIYAVEQSFAINSARRGIERMVRDMREATYSDEGAFPIIFASPYEFYFYSDVDRDDNVERVRFYIENGLLKRAQTKAVGIPPTYPGNADTTSLVSDHVRNVVNTIPMFRYYDTAGNEVSNLSHVTDIAFVVVHMIVDINPYRLPNDFVLQSSASLRNLSEN